MLPDISFATKLWNRGVDIAASAIASTISGAILAIIAGVAYFIKLRLDLKHDASKQHQAIQIANEETQKRKRAEYDANIVVLKRDQHNMAAAMGSAPNQQRMQELWNDYRDWLKRNGLAHLPGAINVLAQHSQYSDKLINLTDANLLEFRKQLSAAIMRTDLPTFLVERQ
jgi:hypothetical protein